MRTYATVVAMMLTCAATVAQTDTIRYVNAEKGTYNGDGKSWATAKKNLQDAINDLYDYLKRNGLKSGRVLVSEGTYSPTETTASEADGVLNTSFKIYEGISVYGGFAKDETNDNISPNDRQLADNLSQYPWVMKHKTILTGNHSTSINSDPMTWDNAKGRYEEAFPGNSYHVVWFATKGFDGDGRAKPLDTPARIDGCIIRDGYASNRNLNGRQHTSFGGGAYMVAGAELHRCVLTQNAAARRGGAVYMDGGGLVNMCYMSRNQCMGVGINDGLGGAVCMEDGKSLMIHTATENNAARMGGGLAIWTELDYSSSNTTATKQQAFLQPAATGCVVNNNTSSTEAGGVLMRGGTLNHVTIVNNSCLGQDITYEQRRLGRSAGIYVDLGARIVNSVCWGGEVKANRNAQYAAFTRNSVKGVYEPRVEYTAFAMYEHTDWTGTTKNNVMALSQLNSNASADGYYPQFKQPKQDGSGNGVVGVCPTTADTNYFYCENQDWRPDGTSQLRAQGVQISDMSNNANIIQAHITQDYMGNTFMAKTTLGAMVPYIENIRHSLVASQENGEADEIPTLFVDPTIGKSKTVDNTNVGESWDMPLGNINDALKYFEVNKFAKAQILVKQGETTAAGNYTYGTLRTSTLKMVDNVRLYGGYPSANTGKMVDGRNPVNCPTRINADIANIGYAYNVCHLVNFSNVTGAVFDGFQLYYANAYDANTDTGFTPAIKNGGGIICGNTNTAPGTEIEMNNRLRNCVIANCTALQGAAVYVTSRSKSVKMTIENCIFHNNEAKATTAPGIFAANGSLTEVTLNHCTIRGNVGYGVVAEADATVSVNNTVLHANARSSHEAITDLTSTDILAFSGTSISGSNNRIDAGATIPSGLTNTTATLTYLSTETATYPKFVNPTRNVGVTHEGDITVYGGDPDFMPGNMNPIVNAANDATTNFGTDMAGTERSYGGAADIGAIENTALPQNDGNTYYVRDADGNDNNDGLSWGTAFKTVAKAQEKAKSAVTNDATKVINIWVAEGEYTNTPDPNTVLVNQPYAYELIERVNMYGGFPNYGNPGENERNPNIFHTILQPKTSATDFPTSNNNIPDCLGRVLVQNTDFTTETVCNGFILQNGFLNAVQQQGVSGDFQNNINDNIYKVGGAGALLRGKGVLENCIIRYNRIYGHGVNSYSSNLGANARVSAGGGVFNYGGTIKNCQIINNALRAYSKDAGSTFGVFVFGGGCYMKNNGTYKSLMFNTLIADNELSALTWASSVYWHTVAIGAGICLKEGDFYNNTIIKNTAKTANCNHANVMCGGAYLYQNAKIYNSIVYDNISEGGRTDNKGLTADKNEQILSLALNNTASWGGDGSGPADNEDNLGFIAKKENIHIYHSNVGYTVNGIGTKCNYLEYGDVTYASRNNTFELPAFDVNNPYHLTSSSPAVNKGTEYEFGTSTLLGIPEYDAEYNDRIQDCTIDMGAYEYNGSYNITPTVDGNTATYYVTQNGDGNASAANPSNAACMQKLQKVLDAAGRYRATEGNEGKTVIVKLAAFDGGYVPRRTTETSGSGEVNPRTYSIVVPRGVQVWGGYKEDFNENARDIVNNKTKLSGLFQAEGQDVNVYHVVTFTEDVYDENGEKNGTTLNSGTAVLDGLFIEGGMAEGEVNIDETKLNLARYGGAAIVPNYAHIRNCIIRENEAIDGGGALYLKHGALVSGCLFERNTATKGNGGAIYVEKSSKTTASNGIDTSIARVLTSTIVNNYAEKDGGGIYFVDSDIRVNSSVMWQNVSNGDHNVCGETDPGSTTVEEEPDIEEYPMSYCAVENLSVAGINNINVSSTMNQGVRFSDFTSVGNNENVYNGSVSQYGFYKPLVYSVLTRSGMAYDYYGKMKTIFTTLEDNDLSNTPRIGTFDNGYIEIGARAIGENVKLTPTASLLMKRIFVASPTGSTVDMDYVAKLQNLGGTEYYSQRGSSQAYPMLYLDDALEYVREARKSEEITGVDDMKFEIFLRAGTYTPRRDIKGQRTELSRGNTYLVPEGVSIFGGLGTNANADGSFYGATDQPLPSVDGMTILQTATDDILAARETYDNNQNNIIEPWEFKNISELSGSVTNGTSSLNVFHVISCIADENHVGKLPLSTSNSMTADGTAPMEQGTTILLDGIKISNGNALNYDKASAESEKTYYRGGAICVDGNWTTNDTYHTYTDASGNEIQRPVGYRNIPLEIRNCKFIDNKGGLGGAIYTDGELKILTSTFVRNTAEDGEDYTDNGTIQFDGRGGAINASYQTTIVNSIFANNEADARSGSTSSQAGFGGAISMGEYSSLHMINCDVVRNKATSYPAIYAFKPNQGYTSNTASDEATLKNDNPHKIVNTVFWGNEADGNGRKNVFNFSTDNAEALWFCAYEEGCGLTPVSQTNETTDFRKAEYSGFGSYIPYLWKDLITEDSEKSTYLNNGLCTVTNNIILSDDNEATDGPNFINPTTEAGTNGHNESADWMIGRINNLTDNGWTYLKQNDNRDGFKTTADGKSDGSGIYWSTRYDQGNATLAIGDETYMKYANTSDASKKMMRVSLDPNPTHDQSFIDIGAYEYQHVKLVPSTVEQVDILWVTEKENQSSTGADGKTWETATSDLQRAIETLLASRNNHRKEIRLLQGKYQPVYTISNNLGFNINTKMHNSAAEVPDNAISEQTSCGILSLTLQGGWSKDVKGQYSVKDYPAYLFAAERTGISEDKLSHVLKIDCTQQIKTSKNTNGQLTHFYTNEVVPITLEGLVFCNIKGKKHTDGTETCSGGAAIYYKEQKDQNESNANATYLSAPTRPANDYCLSNLYKKLTIRQCNILLNGYRSDKANTLPAVTIGSGGGQALIYNTLFHSNVGNPIEADSTTVINCTFAMNGGHVKLNTASELHNSLFWRNDLGGNSGQSGNPGNPGNSGEPGHPGQPSTDIEGLTPSEAMTHNVMTSLTADDTTTNNYQLSTTNNDVLKGPNFKNPLENLDDNDGSYTNLIAMSQRDFGVSPSAKVIGVADHNLYIKKIYKEDYSGSTIAEAQDFLKTINSKKDNTELTSGISADDATFRADADDKADKDLGYENRIYGAAGMEVGAYECIATLDQVLYYYPNYPSGGNGKTWATAYGKNELQKAIDAAAVYPIVMKKDENAYVIAKSGSTEENITIRDKVGLIASMPTNYTKQWDDKNNESQNIYSDVEEYIKTIVNDRGGVAALDERTIVRGVNAEGEEVSHARFDGLEISNTTTQLTAPVIDFTAATTEGQGAFVLTNSIVQGNNMATGTELANVASGLLYNMLFRNNSQGSTTQFSTVETTPTATTGHMVNCTIAPNSVRPKVNNTANNIIAADYDDFAPYLGSETVTIPYPTAKTYGKNLWYQLQENSTMIDGGSEELTSKGLPQKLADLINYTTDTDLLGNNRKLSTTVDCGCFETWSTKNEKLTATTSIYPHTGSVVYAMADNPLVCAEDIGDGKMNPAYLLVAHGGSLYGQGNKLSLDYVAVERSMNGQYALASVPFRFGGITKQGSSLTTPADGEMTFYSYDGKARSAWDYTYKADDSELWKLTTKDNLNPCDGFLISRTATGNATYRFTILPPYTYEEDGTTKDVVLTQYDNNTITGDGEPHFTTLYNMGWNLKGLPWLVSNYNTVESDGTPAMNVPHIFYTMDDTGKYSTKSSWTAGTTTSVGEAFFTQTAIIGTEEKLHFLLPKFDESNTRAAQRTLEVSITEGDDHTTEDAIRLNPCTDGCGSLAYSLGRDGVKFAAMNDTLPEIAVRGSEGLLLSMLGNAPVDTEIGIDLTAKRNGSYTFALTENGGEGEKPAASAVWLKDSATGNVTNLAAANYTVSLDQPGSYSNRFTLTIGNKQPDGGRSDGDATWTIVIDHCHLTVEGLTENAEVSIYSLDGITRHKGIATNGTFEANVTPGVYVVRAEGGTRKVECRR